MTKVILTLVITLACSVIVYNLLSTVNDVLTMAVNSTKGV